VAASHRLPALRGDRLRVDAVEVTYGPGEASKAHTHPCPVVGYVLEGAVRMQVDDGPVTTHRVGETFYEEPGSAHQLSANASASTPARFLAVFVCDGDASLSTRLPEARE